MINKLLTLGLIVLTGLALGMAVNREAVASAAQEVYAVCQASRMSATITEQHCADLQDKYDIEFLCEDANTLASNHCWVEVK